MKSIKTFEALGATLTIMGSFLPWENAGGFAGYNINGVRVDLAGFQSWAKGYQSFPVYDYGGVFVIVLTLAFVFLSLQPPRLIRNPILLNLVISVALLTSLLFFVGRGVVHEYEDRNFAEPRLIMFGLVIVVIGSGLLLVRAIIAYRQTVLKAGKQAKLHV
jgi:hypothetical protein